MNNNPKSILLVDDNADIGEMVKNIILVYQRKRGGAPIDFVFAPDAVAGVEAARQKRFSLILMDYQMPERDGIWATAQIKEINPQTPIVFLSAYTSRGEVEAARQAGAAAYVAKTVFTQVPVVYCLIDCNCAGLKEYADDEEIWLFVSE